MTPKLLNLVRAMAEFEGWHYAGSPGAQSPAGSVSYRNHNPGNLRKSIFAIGERDGFAVFVDDHVGFFALAYDIFQKARGQTRTGLSGNSTIYDLIRVYSGEPPDVVLRYARHVESRTGLPMTTKLKELLIP